MNTGPGYVPRRRDAPYRIWGEGLEPDAVQQLRNACKLPVAVSAALMPDAHVGYGLPIGGVLATSDAVIPYAVGVDIACRMKMTVLDLPVSALADDRDRGRLTSALEQETRFGMGAAFRSRRQHMELMGRYAAANHELIHRHVARALGVEVRLDIENHHNFAWRERHRLSDGSEADVIVHRKGATPAGAGVLGVIPGSMGTPGYVVRGKGVAASLNSAAHGAGRRMSRTKAKATFTWDAAQQLLRERGVTLLSAGLDEVPMAYKDIDQVMAAQHDLVEPLARFEPRLVKMAPSGEPPED
jgi:RNA-splicing ligase RtcB